MSKVDELRAKYPTVNIRTFQRFVEGDNTPTKKYLEYLLKVWTTKNVSIPATHLVKEVLKFDELLPYHQNKDIYSSDYKSYKDLVRRNERAEEVKDDKTFDRKEHVDVIFEDDNIIFLVPKTHKGSLKYGSGTQWCTASKGNPHTFERYARSGCLAYLIRKKETGSRKYDKVAFYNNGTKALAGEIEIYNQTDNNIQEGTLINNGWSHEKIGELMLRFRAYHLDKEMIRKTKSQVTNMIDVMKNINLDELHSNLQYLEKRGETEFKDVNNLVSAFVNKVEESLKNFKV